MGDQRYAGEGLIDLEQADVVDAEAGGRQGLAGGVQDGGELRNGICCRDRQGPERARGIRPCRSAEPQPAMSKAAASGPGRLTAGETTRASRSEAGMLISISLYNRIAYDAFV